MKRYWHFLPADRRLRYEDGRIVEPGGVYRCPDDKPLMLCQYGMHASRSALDALRYALGPIVCRVTLHGEVIEGDDKAVARERRVVWMADATDVIRAFAFRCADRAVRVHAVAALRRAKLDAQADRLEALAPVVDAETADAAGDATGGAARDAAWDAAGDARHAAGDAAWAARHAAGDAAWAARHAAWAAAGDATGDAAWAAAWAAAGDATGDAAWAAAWDAAWDAAWAAARAAAWDAARDAAWDAARDAAWAAARAAAWDAQATDLHRALLALGRQR